jgi:pimeloyl-ACP methyl ester carboxylesterase
MDHRCACEYAPRSRELRIEYRLADRVSLVVRTSIIALAAMTIAFSSAEQRAPAALSACTTSTAACTEWVTLRPGPARSMIYRSYPLDTRNDRIRRALIMVHGANRNADHYFATAMAAAFLANAVDDTVVIAPRIIACADKPEPNEVLWSCNGDSWRSGGAAASNPELSSFDLADEILRKLAKTNVFPNMQAIVVAGHSAGGQYVTRYEMANHVHETLGVPVTYVVANPSSYAWPAATRPAAADDGDPAAAKDGWKSEAVHTKFSYGLYDGANCQNYNHWPFGFESRTAGYTTKMSEEQLKTQLVARPTTYLLGQVDTLPLGGFDSSCSAMAQGPTRRARGEAFLKFVNETLGAKHQAVIVPECGHNDRCIYTTDIVFPIIFPR